MKKRSTIWLFALLLFAGCASSQQVIQPERTITPTVLFEPTKTAGITADAITPTMEVELTPIVTPELVQTPTKEAEEITPTVTITVTPTLMPTVTPTAALEPTDLPTPTPEYYTVENWKDASIGAKIKFGSFEQDNNTKNGTEEIEWLIIDEDEENFLVVSTYALEAMSFMKEQGAIVTWEDSLVRQWMQEAFYPTAFTEIEKQKIVKSP